MQIYKKKTVGFWQLLGECFEGYPLMFQRAWYLFALLIFFSFIALVLTKINLYVGLSFFVLIMLVNIYIHAIILHRSHYAFKGEWIELYSSVKYANQRYLRLLGGLVVWFVIAILLGVIGAGIALLGKVLGLAWLTTLIIVLFVTFVIVLFYYAMPVIVLERRGVFESFQKSIRLFFGSPWSTTFIFLITFAIVLILHLILDYFFRQIGPSFWFMAGHLLFQFITYPLLFSTVLVLLHNAKLKVHDSADY